MIIRNAVQCRNCHDIIESKYRFDYCECKCGQVAVSGGTDRLERRHPPLGRGDKYYKELSIEQ